MSARHQDHHSTPASRLSAALAFLLTAGAALAVGIHTYPAVGCPTLADGDHLARTPVHHVFFLIQENHAFENYFGSRPGVLGFPPRGAYPVAFGSNLTITPFPLAGSSTPDVPHDITSEQADLDNGKLDGFVAQARALGAIAPQDAIGYYPRSAIPNYWAYADHYGLADRFFSGVLGPTLPNRAFDLAGTSAGWTSDEIPPAGTFDVPTIFDQLRDRGVPFAYDFAGAPSFLAPELFPSLTSGPCALSRIVPVTELPTQLSQSNPPAVVFLDPSSDSVVSEHPAANVTTGSEWATAIVNTIFASPVGPSSVVFLYWDEAGGFADPILPPVQGTTRDGFRVPLLVLSPWTPAGSVFDAPLDPAALLRFVDDNWGMSPLNDRVRAAPELTGFFDFSAPRTSALFLPTHVSISAGTSFGPSDPPRMAPHPGGPLVGSGNPASHYLARRP